MVVVSRIASELKTAWAFQDDLQKLQSELRLLESYLLGAADRNNPVEEKWLKMVKNVAYDVDDLLDEYAYEICQREVKKKKKQVESGSSTTGLEGTSHGATSVPDKRRGSSITKIRRRIFSNSNWRMARKFKHMMSKIARIYHDALKLGIKPVELASRSRSITSANEEARQLQDHRIWVDDLGLIGRDQAETEIHAMLHHPSNQERNLSVVAITGLAGLGKISLAKRVFKKEKDASYFEKTIWVTVSHDFDVSGLLKRMAEYLFGDANIHSILESAALVEKLGKELREKRYLLILDDVWDTMTDKWNPLRSSLQDINGSKGTTILVTSRTTIAVETMEILGLSMTRPLIHELKGLTDDDSWCLFEYAFGERRIEEATTRRLVKKCCGLPLAIKALGRLLKSQSTDKWNDIELSGLWDLEDRDGILPSLKLSFNYLPSATVKKCFSYCAIFPEDAIIKKEQLIQLWMAHGYLHKPNYEMEEIGNKYFNILLDNSFFQDIELDKLGNVITCKMHDVVHVLTQVTSKEELRVFQDCTEENHDSLRNVDYVRHLRVDSTIHGLYPLLDKIGERIRTLITPTSIDLGNFTTHFSCLRVLSMVGIGLEVLPIGVLKHLKYLDISGNKIRELPNTFFELYNLQTLRMAGNYLIDFRILLQGLTSLINLRHVTWTSLGIWKGLGQLTSLRTLPVLDFCKAWGGTIDELKSLTNLAGRLEIRGLELVKGREELKSACFWNKSKVEELVLSWFKNQNGQYDEDLLEGLYPHPNLKALEICYYRGLKSPEWKRLASLKRLDLYECSNLDSFPDLQGLANLCYLKIRSCIGSASSYILSTALLGCSSLKELHIESCPGLDELPNLDDLVSLRFLTIKSCNKLKCISTSGSLQGCTSLVKLKVSSCPVLTELPTLHGLPSLIFVYIYDCMALLKVGSLENCFSLSELIIRSCPNLNNLPLFQGCSSLERLKIVHCPSLEALPDLKPFAELNLLQITDCQRMTSPFSRLHCLPNLIRCILGPFNEESEWFPFPADLHEGSPLSRSLQQLMLVGWPKEILLPQQLRSLIVLQYLSISGFGIQVIPEWIGDLTSLQELRLEYMERLEFLPSHEAILRLTKFKSLQIYECPVLGQKCFPETGPEWFKISHIPSIYINGKTVRGSICM